MVIPEAFLVSGWGYSAETCFKNIKVLIRVFSKSFVVDKTRGLRNNNIVSRFNNFKKGRSKRLPIISFPWFF